MERDTYEITLILIVCTLFFPNCSEVGRRTSIDGERLSTAYAELAIVAGGDSVKAKRILDSLEISRESFVAAVSEKAEDLKDWQVIHEEALRKMEVAALREDRRRADPVPPAVR